MDKRITKRTIQQNEKFKRDQRKEKVSIWHWVSLRGYYKSPTNTQAKAGVTSKHVVQSICTFLQFLHPKKERRMESKFYPLVLISDLCLDDIKHIFQYEFFRNAGLIGEEGEGGKEKER